LFEKPVPRRQSLPFYVYRSALEEYVGYRSTPWLL